MPEPTEKPAPEKVGTSLTKSIASDSLDLVSSIGDVAIEAIDKGGLLDKIPIFGLLHGTWKALRHVPELLFERKVERMLAAVADNSTLDERRAFVDGIFADGKDEHFGETILMLIEKADEVEKPALIGRVMAAHIRGDLAHAAAFRICSMINRAYYPDLERLKEFRRGTGEADQFAFTGLAAVGLLTAIGDDGGDWVSEDPATVGGTEYALNQFSVALVKYGFEVRIEQEAAPGTRF